MLSPVLEKEVLIPTAPSPRPWDPDPSCFNNGQSCKECYLWWESDKKYFSYECHWMMKRLLGNNPRILYFCRFACWYRVIYSWWCKSVTSHIWNVWSGLNSVGQGQMRMNPDGPSNLSLGPICSNLLIYYKKIHTTNYENFPIFSLIFSLTVDKILILMTIWFSLATMNHPVLLRRREGVSIFWLQNSPET